MDAEVQSAIREEVRGAVMSSQNQMLDHIDTLITSKLDTAIQTQRETSETQMGKITQDILQHDAYKFNRKSCEDQFKFNTKVTGKLREADAVLESGNIPDARVKISEGIDLIKHRQKLVKMADSSDIGWKLVSEYVSNPLAEDSEDEKRINRAYSSANHKIKAKEKKKQQQRRRFRPYPHPSRQSSQPQGKEGRPGVCYNCYKPGHWAAECTEKKRVGGSQLSTIRLNVCKNVHESLTDIVLNSGMKVSLIEHSQAKLTETHSSEHQECEKQLLSESRSPVGRLKLAINKWKVSGANSYVLSVIESGYGLPLKKLPPATDIRNNRSALTSGEFVESEIEKLLTLGCIEEVDKSEVHVVNPLTVAENRSGKKRMVLD
ncbi:hypothetical protein FSP39_005630 [Pinctada imbricata]|uniref:CCHC-type domain-containing protein n=1 Tax=Pinctada imbricata TaxID=66713 RepID=A0AA89BWJ6_PINIB|nr:hypothetical protein FSP39_005630 [Pinctada imbricata]